MVFCAGQLEQAVCTLTSIFSSPPESSLLRIRPPLCPCLMDTVPLQHSWRTYTWLHILSCVGCQPSWQSGLGRNFRMSWDFPTKLTRGQAAPGWSFSWGDLWQEGCCSKGTDCALSCTDMSVPCTYIYVKSCICTWHRHEFTYMYRHVCTITYLYVHDINMYIHGMYRFYIPV